MDDFFALSLLDSHRRLRCCRVFGLLSSLRKGRVKCTLSLLETVRLSIPFLGALFISDEACNAVLTDVELDAEGGLLGFRGVIFVGRFLLPFPELLGLHPENF